jgi:hypothetical protein
MFALSKRAVLLLAAAVTGVSLAAALTVAPKALAWDWHSLPSGYGVYSYQLVCHTSTDNCLNGDNSTCDVVTITAPNATPNQTSVQDCSDPNFQAEIDAFVNATVCTVNPAADPSLCSPTTTSVASTTAQTTTTPTTTTAAAPASTTTTTSAAPASSPAVATASPTLAAAPAPATTTTQTVTVTTTVEDPSLTQRVTALEQNYAALAARVNAIEQANAAAWQTYHDDIVAGLAPAAAALDARSVALNAVYQL